MIQKGEKNLGFGFGQVEEVYKLGNTNCRHYFEGHER